MTTTRIFTTDASYTPASRAGFTMRSLDPKLRAHPATDYIFDARYAVGHASGAVPSSGSSLGAGGLVNLARDSHRVLPAAVKGAVTLKAQTGTAQMGDDGAGHVGVRIASPSFGTCVAVNKAALALNAVGHPPTEGYYEFVEIVWIRLAALGAQNLFGYGNATGSVRYWSVGMNAGNVVSEYRSGKSITGFAANVWTQVAIHYRFNTGTGAIYVRTFKDGAEQNASSAGTAIAITTTDMTGYANTVGKQGILGNTIDTGTGGMVARVERHFTALTGYEIDPAVEVAANWAALKADFGL